MKFIDLLIQKSVLQWSRCYYDYQGVKLLVSHATKSAIVLQKMKDLERIFSYNKYDTQSSDQLYNPQNKSFLSSKMKQSNQAILKSLSQANILFYQYHALNKTVVFLFCQMKFHQLNRRIDSYQKWATKIHSCKDQYLILLNNVFHEGKLLFRMCEVNGMAYKTIQIQHVKAFQQFSLESPHFQSKSLDRTMQELEMLFIRLQNLYIISNEPFPKRLLSEAYERKQQKPFEKAISSYIFGLSNGISLSLVALSIIIYAQSPLDPYDAQFVVVFPVWRAIAYIIFFIWAFAADIIVCQRYRINYQLVFGGEGRTIQRSSQVLDLASGFTLIFMVLYVIHLLDLTSLIHISEGGANYFPIIIWAIVLLLLLFPFPVFNHKGRIMFLKQLLMTLFSPLFPVKFNVIFINYQLTSMILPISDLVYTICYYSHESLTDIVAGQASQCQDYQHSAEYFGLVIFVYRVIQSLKVAYQNQAFLHTRQMYTCIRASLNAFLILVSLLTSIQKKLVYFWIVIVVPIFVFNYYVDLKWDWALLAPNSKNKYLRDNITLDPYKYYIIMVANFFFRIISMLCYSDNIIWEITSTPLYFSFIIAIAQIARQLFWNILKIQREHIANTETFTIKKNYKHNEKIILKQLVQKNAIDIEAREQQVSLDRERQEAEIQNLKGFLQKKVCFRKKINAWKYVSYRLLLQIEKHISEYHINNSKPIKKKK